MSVILFDAEKFSRIEQSLDCREREHNFYYCMRSENRPSFDEATRNYRQLIHEFCAELHAANVDCWNQQYNESELIKPLTPCGYVKPYTPVELYKALQSVAYNLVCNDGSRPAFDGLVKTLDALIESVANQIITALPEYDRANTWA
jgi:hypothetical protein